LNFGDEEFLIYIAPSREGAQNQQPVSQQ